jgi:hypothetical protein
MRFKGRKTWLDAWTVEDEEFGTENDDNIENFADNVDTLTGKNISVTSVNWEI